MNCDCPSCQCAASRRDCRNTQISGFLSPVLLLQRGALRDRHERWERDAMDAARHQTNDVMRTAKSCGPGAPTLALSSRRRIPCLAGDGGKKARFTGETTYKPLKPLRRECRLLRLNLWFCRVLFLLHADHGCSPHPAFPAPSSSDEGGLLEKLGRIAPRECDHMVGDNNSLRVVPAN